MTHQCKLTGAGALSGEELDRLKALLLEPVEPPASRASSLRPAQSCAQFCAQPETAYW